MAVVGDAYIQGISGRSDLRSRQSVGSQRQIKRQFCRLCEEFDVKVKVYLQVRRGSRIILLGVSPEGRRALPGVEAGTSAPCEARRSQYR